MNDSNTNNKNPAETESRPTLRPEFQGAFKDRHKEKSSQRCESRAFEVTDLDAPVDKQRLTHEELDQIDDQRREQGKLLASKIYKLTSEVREANLEVYVRTINDAVLNLSSEANQAILETACDYFASHFGPTLKEKGHSPQMIDAIVHRAGRQSRAVIERVISGFDVQDIAQNIWNDAIDHDVHTEARALAYMRDLTNQQVRELREVYNTIPAKLLAELLHDALHRTNIDGKSYPNVFLIKYILQGRSKREVGQIEFQFNEHFHYVRFGEGEQSLREQVEQLIPENEIEEIRALLEGFQVDYFVAQILKMLETCGHVSEPDPSHSLHPDFAGRFRKSYATAPVFEQELRARDAIDDLLSFCTKEQFEEINAALKETHDIELTACLYRCNSARSPRKVALVLEKGLTAITPRRECTRDEDYLSDELLQEVKEDFRLGTNQEIKDVVKIHAEEVKARECEFKLRQGLSALRYLDPHELYEVELHFHALFNEPLKDFVNREVERISRGDIQKYSQTLIDLMLSGTGRLGLKADLFNLFQSRERRLAGKIEAAEKQRVREQSIDGVEKLNRILKRNQSPRERAKAALAVLSEFDSYALSILEQVFLELSQSGSSLRAALQEALPELEFRILDTYFDGIDLFTIAEKLSEQPTCLFDLVLSEPWVIETLLALIEKDEVKSLKRASGVDSQIQRLLLQSILEYPNIARLKELFTSAEPLEEVQVDEFLLLLKNASSILALESGYNRQYSRFHYCHEPKSGTLLQRLRVLGSLGLIPRRAFAEAILLLEGIEPSITAELHSHLDGQSISLESLSHVESILLRNRANLQTIKKSYNALNEEQTLRETIYGLHLPLRIKNRLILALDGYNPAGVAAEVHEVVKNHTGHVLAEKLHAILATPSRDTKNTRIPSNPNWTDEMYNQVRLAYHGRYGVRLVTQLRQKEVVLKGLGLNLLCFKLYGEISKKVVDLRKLTKALAVIERGDQRDKIERALIKLLDTTLPALRERMLDMYVAYYGPLDGDKSVSDIFTGMLKSQEHAQELEDLILESELWDQPEDDEDMDSSPEDLDSLLEQLEAVA